MSQFYSFVRDGYTPKASEWHRVEDCLPKMVENFLGQKTSQRVLITANGVEIGYICEDFDGSFKWILSGRDMYSVSGVTHWQWLPCLP